MTGDAASQPGWRSRRDERGRFINTGPLGSAASRGVRDLLRWQLQRARTGVEPDPPPGAFDVAVPDLALPRAQPAELRITWVGHSTFLIQIGGVNVLTDPVWSDRASPVSWLGPTRLVAAAVPFAQLPPIDAVVISHDHYDHLDARTVHRLHDRYGAGLQWIAPLGHAAWLRRRGVTGVIELDWWHSATLATEGGELMVAATPAQHWTKRTPFSERLRLWASFIIAAPAAGRVFFCGDSGYFGGFGEIGRRHGPFAAVLLPIGAYEPRWFMQPAHMNPAEAVQSYVDLGGSGTFIGMHWGTFRLTDEPAFEPPERTRAEWGVRGLPAADLWIPRHGESRVIGG